MPLPWFRLRAARGGHCPAMDQRQYTVANVDAMCAANRWHSRPSGTTPWVFRTLPSAAIGCNRSTVREWSGPFASRSGNELRRTVGFDHGCTWRRHPFLSHWPWCVVMAEAQQMEPAREHVPKGGVVRHITGHRSRVPDKVASARTTFAPALRFTPSGTSAYAGPLRIALPIHRTLRASRAHRSCPGLKWPGASWCRVCPGPACDRSAWPIPHATPPVPGWGKASPCLLRDPTYPTRW